MSIYTRHALFWAAIYVIWTYLKSGGGLSVNVAAETLINMTAHMLVFYILQLLLIPRFYAKGRRSQFIVGLLMLVISIYMYWWLINSIGLLTIAMDTYILETVQSFVPAMILMAIESHGDQNRQREKRRALEKQKMVGELKLLKSQINPQFLLGTLQNLYENVINKSPDAPEMIMRLSDILDHVLYKSQKEYVTLQEEIKTIENFVFLEKIRFNHRLKVTWNVAGDLTSFVSPLVLLDVVQHLFHVIGSVDQQTNMEINITDANFSISFLLWYSSENQSSVDLLAAERAIKRQLDLVYPDLHLFSLQRQADVVRLSLTINTMN